MTRMRASPVDSPSSRCFGSELLLRCDGGVVYYKGCLKREVFSSEEVDPHRLTSERRHVESSQHVSSRFV